jgi:RNA polymerase sigma-70 factor (ECF subfamily)
MDQKEKEQHFSEIYFTFKDKIHRICYGYIYEKEQVEDLFQEIMINIWNSLDRFRGDSAIGTWIYRIAVNTALLYNKKTKFYNKHNVPVNDFSTEIKAVDPDDYNSRNEELRMLGKCISQLEKNDRLIISLILENLTYEQVSEIIGITPNHVGVKVNRIKRKLMSLINDMNYERI